MSIKKTKSNISLKFNGKKGDKEKFISHIKKIYKSAQISLVTTYWWIGRNISKFYKKEYGKETLKKIADEVGISENTLGKACKFAKQYSEDQMTELTTGEFPVSWYMLSHNLTIDAEDVMKIYQESDTAKEFRDNITKFKEKRQEKEEENDNEDDPEDEDEEVEDDNEDDVEEEEDEEDDPEDEDDEVDKEDDEDQDDQGDEDNVKRKKKVKKSKKDKKTKSDIVKLSFDDECKYHSKKRDLLLIAKFKKDKAKSITPESLETAFANIASQLLHKDYTVSVMPASKKSAASQKKRA